MDASGIRRAFELGARLVGGGGRVPSALPHRDHLRARLERVADNVLAGPAARPYGFSLG